MYDIPDDWGTAVNVQTMVYGNTGDESRAPAWPSRATPRAARTMFYGEFLVNAQGEDVVAGVRTPRPVERAQGACGRTSTTSSWTIRQTLERELRDMQDFEFTIEKGRLFMLQTRNGKRTGLAAIRIAVDMADEGLITPDEALMRIEPEQLNQLLRPIFGPDDEASRPSTRAGSRPRACPPAPAPPPAASSSTRRTRSPGRRAARRSCWSATSRARTTSAAWTPPRASSRRRAA